MTSKFAEFMARACRWMLGYSNVEIVLISFGILALACLLIYVGIRVIDVMIYGSDDDV